MPTYTASMRVVHHETWEVKAKDEAEARAKINAMHDDVIDDDSGGEVVDIEIRNIKPVQAETEIYRLLVALHRIASLEEKNVPKYAQEIARQALEQ